jgi:hypothetical protein
MFGPQLGLGLGLGIAAAYTVTAPWLPMAFTDDADVAAAVWSLLPLVIGMLPLNALVYVLDGVLLGASDFQFLAGAHGLHSHVSLHTVLRCSARRGIPSACHCYCNEACVEAADGFVMLQRRTCRRDGCCSPGHGGGAAGSRGGRGRQPAGRVAGTALSALSSDQLSVLSDQQARACASACLISCPAAAADLQQATAALSCFPVCSQVLAVS